MKKLIVIFLALAGWFCLPVAVAQDQPLKLGLKVAPQISFMSPETKHYTYDGVTGGATIGLVSDFYFATNYAFSTGFNFAFLNGRLTYTDSLFLATDSIYGQMNRKYKFVYLDIPYTIKLQTNTFGRFSFFGQIGFSTGFRISAKARDQFEPEKGGTAINETTSISAQSTLIRQAVIFGGGLKYHLDVNTRIFAGVNYSNSLNNILKGHNSATGLNEKALLNFLELNLGVLF